LKVNRFTIIILRYSALLTNRAQTISVPTLCLRSTPTLGISSGRSRRKRRVAVKRKRSNVSSKRMLR